LPGLVSELILPVCGVVLSSSLLEGSELIFPVSDEALGVVFSSSLLEGSELIFPVSDEAVGVLLGSSLLPKCS
jgi:hypothetical protein